MHTNETNAQPASPEAITATVATMPAAKPVKAKAKRTSKPKAAKPSKPATTDKLSAERDRCHANRAIVEPHYNGASLATHRSRAPKLADALARIADPIQRAKSPTKRDESALALCLARADRSGTFCPVDATSDLGTLSRLASLGFLTVAGQRAKLTKAGAELARNVAKRANG